MDWTDTPPVGPPPPIKPAIPIAGSLPAQPPPIYTVSSQVQPIPPNRTVQTKKKQKRKFRDFFGSKYKYAGSIILVLIIVVAIAAPVALKLLKKQTTYNITDAYTELCIDYDAEILLS